MNAVASPSLIKIIGIIILAVAAPWFIAVAAMIWHVLHYLRRVAQQRAGQPSRRARREYDAYLRGVEEGLIRR